MLLCIRVVYGGSNVDYEMQGCKPIIANGTDPASPAAAEAWVFKPSGFAVALIQLFSQSLIGWNYNQLKIYNFFSTSAQNSQIYVSAGTV
jgi:hypothetical protein